MGKTYNDLFHYMNRRLSKIPSEKRHKIIKNILESSDYKEIISEDFKYFVEDTEEDESLEVSNVTNFNENKETSIKELHSFYVKYHPETIGDEDHNKTLKYGRTPLHQAVIDANIDEILYNLDSNSIKIKDNSGLTAYELSKVYGNKEIIKIFEEFSIR